MKAMITSKGQITIPLRIWQKFHFKAGDQLEFDEQLARHHRPSRGESAGMGINPDRLEKIQRRSPQRSPVERASFIRHHRRSPWRPCGIHFDRLMITALDSSVLWAINQH